MNDVDDTESNNALAIVVETSEAISRNLHALTKLVDDCHSIVTYVT